MLNFSEQNFDFLTKAGKHIVATARLDTADFNALRAGIEDDEYDLKDFDFNDNDVVLDLGSATGGEAMLLSTMNSVMKILAFEPLSDNARLLNQNIKLNGFKNITTFLLAVMPKPGITKIYLGDPKTEVGKHHYFIGTAIVTPGLEFEEVQGTTLEDIFKFNDIQYCKLLKMDVEGPELEILKTAPGWVLDRIDWIIGEHHTETRKEILAATKGLFEDVPCRYQTDSNIGHFRFRRKK